MNNSIHNRTILIICFMLLVGFLATIITDSSQLIAVIAAVAGPLATYLGLKGMGTKTNPDSDS